jgi:hypothetical protein
MADEDEIEIEEEEVAEDFVDVPEDLDDDDIAAGDDDVLADDDDDEFVDAEVVDDDEDEDEAVVPPVVPKAKRDDTDDDDDDEEELDPDDVEADLDTILKDRIAAAPEEEEEDELEEIPDERSSEGTRVQPKRADEVSCSLCFLLISRSQIDAARDECPSGYELSDCPAYRELKR